MAPSWTSGSARATLPGLMTARSPSGISDTVFEQAAWGERNPTSTRHASAFPATDALCQYPWSTTAPLSFPKATVPTPDTWPAGVK
eukprot:scaffold36217_cov41-Phaeocystis_antarctica.AAC.3